MASLFSCRSNRELPTVKVVDIHKYCGTWYEIARLPNGFEKGLDCITATYTVNDNGKIEVLNQGHLAGIEGKIKKIKGSAWIPDDHYPGRLKVRFFWPFAGAYYIMYLDDNYTYALVGHPNRKYLWVLSKNRLMDENIYRNLLEVAKNFGFETGKIITVKQDCK